MAEVFPAACLQRATAAVLQISSAHCSKITPPFSLGVAALAAQALADVQLPFGQPRPLSLFFATIAGSGDRKSTTDGEALWPVRKREDTLRTEFDRDHAEWTIAHAAWTAEKRKLERASKMGLEARKEALRLLGCEPEPPLFPILTAADPTVEGLAKIWGQALPSLGLFTAEGGQLIGGHSFSQEHALKTAAALSELWDGRGMRRLRAGDGLTLLPGRRLTTHLMVQPEAASSFLSNPVLRDQGLLSRFLLAAPDSLAGMRFCQETDPADEAAIRAFGGCILSLLETPLPLAPGKSNELDPPALVLTDEAQHLWRGYADHIESLLGSEGPLASLRDVGGKSAEQAARIAGVLTILSDPAAQVIDRDVLADAITIAQWHLNEALRLRDSARTDPRLRQAQCLLDWIRAKGITTLALRDVVRSGPSALRTKSAAEEAIRILTGHNWLAIASDRPRHWQLLPEDDL